MQQVIPVSVNTEELLKSRTDDVRIDIIHELMYGDDIGGIHPNRTITMAETDKETGKPLQYVLRKAGFLDTLKYIKTPGQEIKPAIEQNIQQLQALKENGQGMQGLPPIKDVYIFVYLYDENDDGIKVNTYLNPNSQDIGDVLRTDKQIIMCGFVVSYPTVFPGQKLPEGYPDEVYEWSFLSPLIEASLPEYELMSKKFEAEQLSKMFFLDFKA